MRLFPASWRVEPAHDVCDEIVDCLNKTAPTVQRDTGLKVIRTTNVKRGRVDLEDVRFVEEPVLRKWTRRLLPRRNDIVLTREAPLGEVGLLRFDDKAMLGQRTMAYRADGRKLDEQRKIAVVLSAYDDLIENNRRRITLLERMAE